VVDLQAVELMDAVTVILAIAVASQHAVDQLLLAVAVIMFVIVALGALLAVAWRWWQSRPTRRRDEGEE
jgi:uncharacterized membrane protein YoaK (UPF0700 family)